MGKRIMLIHSPDISGGILITVHRPRAWKEVKVGLFEDFVADEEEFVMD